MKKKSAEINKKDLNKSQHSKLAMLSVAAGWRSTPSKTRKIHDANSMDRKSLSSRK